MAFYCYIVTNKQNGTLYLGSTDCLTTRIAQHKARTRPGFTARYGCDRLVWFQVFDTREGAFRRERNMKEWRRSWKIELIEQSNPNWRDLYWETCGIARLGDLEAFLANLPQSPETLPTHPPPPTAPPPSTHSHPPIPLSAHPGERRDPSA